MIEAVLSNTVPPRTCILFLTRMVARRSVEQAHDRFTYGQFNRGFERCYGMWRGEFPLGIQTTGSRWDAFRSSSGPRIQVFSAVSAQSGK